MFDSFPGHPAIIAWGFINIQIAILSARGNDFTDNVSLPFGRLSEHFGYVRISAG